MAANIFSGATDSTWGTATNWSLGAVPTASDTNVATFDATSPACTVNASNRVCNGLDFTGYTNTITMTFNITVSGSVTLAAGMTIAGTGTLAINTTSTLTSNGKTWPNALTITGATSTHTLADNWTVSGLVSVASSSQAVTINGNTINCGAGITFNATSGSVSGSTVFNVTATGTLSAPSITTGRGILNPIVINAPGGTVTISTVFACDLGKVSYIEGTVIAGNAWPLTGPNRIMIPIPFGTTRRPF